jgi:hypothetical protein
MLERFAAPPPKGELAAAIAALAERAWHHPISDAHTRFGFSTIERWYCRALKEKRDPVAVLRRKLRADAGQQPAMSGAVRQAITAQYATHKSRSVRLHHDNLLALAENNPDLGPVPSYATQRRFLKASGFIKRRRLTSRRTEGAERAEPPFLDREVRSYEAEYIGGLLHFDAHHGSVLTPKGEWVTPILFGVLDDRSRLACHLQWYLFAAQASDAYFASRDRRIASISSRAGSREPRIHAAARGRMLSFPALSKSTGMYRTPGTTNREAQRGTIARPRFAATRLTIVCFSSATCEICGRSPALEKSLIVKSWLWGRDRRSGTIKG